MAVLLIKYDAVSVKHKGYTQLNYITDTYNDGKKLSMYNYT
jgi:hypothetical protein